MSEDLTLTLAPRTLSGNTLFLLSKTNFHLVSMSAFRDDTLAAWCRSEGSLLFLEVECPRILEFVKTNQRKSFPDPRLSFRNAVAPDLKFSVSVAKVCLFAPLVMKLYGRDLTKSRLETWGFLLSSIARIQGLCGSFQDRVLIHHFQGYFRAFLIYRHGTSSVLRWTKTEGGRDQHR